MSRDTRPWQLRSYEQLVGSRFGPRVPAAKCCRSERVSPLHVPWQKGATFLPPASPRVASLSLRVVHLICAKLYPSRLVQSDPDDFCCGFDDSRRHLLSRPQGLSRCCRCTEKRRMHEFASSTACTCLKSGQLFRKCTERSLRTGRDLLAAESSPRDSARSLIVRSVIIIRTGAAVDRDSYTLHAVHDSVR